MFVRSLYKVINIPKRINLLKHDNRKLNLSQAAPIINNKQKKGSSGIIYGYGIILPSNLYPKASLNCNIFDYSHPNPSFKSNDNLNKPIIMDKKFMFDGFIMFGSPTIIYNSHIMMENNFLGPFNKKSFEQATYHSFPDSRTVDKRIFIDVLDKMDISIKDSITKHITKPSAYRQSHGRSILPFYEWSCDRLFGTNNLSKIDDLFGIYVMGMEEII